MNHTLYECNGESCKNRNSCNFCDGGLSLCTVCGGAEITLTTDCVGRKLTNSESSAIIRNDLDFKNGHWVWPKTKTKV